MAFNSSEFFFKNQVEKSRLKFSLTCGGGCDLHGFLTSTKTDMLQIWGNAGAVDGTLSFVGFEAFQAVNVKEFGGVVFGGGDEHGAILGSLHVVDIRFMVLNCIDRFVDLKKYN